GTQLFQIAGTLEKSDGINTNVHLANQAADFRIAVPAGIVSAIGEYNQRPARVLGGFQLLGAEKDRVVQSGPAFGADTAHGIEDGCGIGCEASERFRTVAEPD